MVEEKYWLYRIFMKKRRKGIGRMHGINWFRQVTIHLNHRANVVVHYSIPTAKDETETGCRESNSQILVVDPVDIFTETLGV